MDNVKINVSIVLPGSISKIVIDKKGFEHEFNKHAHQSINMTSEAYDYFISEPPVGTSRRDWARMSKKKRVEDHLKRTCESLGGLSFEYHIFEE